MKPHQSSEKGFGVKCACYSRPTSQEAVVPHRTLACHSRVHHISLNKQVSLVYGCNFDTIFARNRKQFLWIKI